MRGQIARESEQDEPMNRIVEGLHAEPKKLPAERTQLSGIIRPEFNIEKTANSLFSLDLLCRTGRANISW